MHNEGALLVSCKSSSNVLLGGLNNSSVDNAHNHCTVRSQIMYANVYTIVSQLNAHGCLEFMGQKTWVGIYTDKPLVQPPKWRMGAHTEIDATVMRCLLACRCITEGAFNKL